jgi:hypothetical protein
MSFGIPVRNGLGLGLLASTTLATRNVSVAFTPAVLFAAGEQGVWYDPSDLTTLFQDSAGTIPVTAVEQPVGRMLDLSGRGNHATQTTSASRPVLSARVNLLLATATLSTQNVSTVAATYTLAFSGAGSITLSGTAIGVYTAGTYSVVCTTGALVLTVLGVVTNADFRVANDTALPAYQRVTTSTNYDTTGFPLYLQFDGVDDSMSTASISFTGTSQISVFNGIRKLSTAVDRIIFELSVNANTQSGSFYFLANPTGADNVALQLRGSLTNYGSYSTRVNPQTALFSFQLTTIASNAAAAILARVNGVSVSANFTVNNVSTGNFGNYPLYIGARNNAGLFFNGRFYSVIVRGSATSAAQIGQTESWISGKMGGGYVP